MISITDPDEARIMLFSPILHIAFNISGDACQLPGVAYYVVVETGLPGKGDVMLGCETGDGCFESGYDVRQSATMVCNFLHCPVFGGR